MNYFDIASIRVGIPADCVKGPFGKALRIFEVHGGDSRAAAAGSEAASVAGASRAASAASAADMLVQAGGCAAEGADFRELDLFDFSDANADCRFGCDSGGYLLQMIPRTGEEPLLFRKKLGDPTVASNITPQHNGSLVRFGLWTMFNLAALPLKAVAFHSSVIAYKGEAVLFLGESGTGKSTHTRLWLENIPGAELLNDDSPIVRILDGGAAGERVEASGSPWSGKAPCYRDLTMPIRGLVRLSQAPHNSIRRLRPIEAIGALLPSCPPSFAQDEKLQDMVCGILSTVIAQVPVYHLECLPNAEAARLSCATLFEK